MRPFTAVVAWCLAVMAGQAYAMPAGDAGRRPPAARGAVAAEEGRPAHFPHRIWAACDFEVRLPDYGWFGRAETANIPRYLGNRTACRGENLSPQVSVLKAGANPVPGPRMGKHNKLYIRYFLRGTDRATFQHFSLSVSDNAHIRASGLVQGRWAETVLDFTRDSRRNDGSATPFQEGERMDDFQVYAGAPGESGRYELIIDDMIFFSDDPSLPPEPEPFPHRVIFLAGFDTGTDARSRAKYWPGSFEIVADEQAPAGSYWGVARAVRGARGRNEVALELLPARPVGPNTKLRFRYWLEGANRLEVRLHDRTRGLDTVKQVTRLDQRRWATRYVTFSQNERTGLFGRLPVGTEVDRLTFVVPAGAKLYIDEVVLFDAGEPVKQEPRSRPGPQPRPVPAPAPQPQPRPTPAPQPSPSPHSDAPSVLELWDEGITIAGSKPFLLFAAWADGTVVRRTTLGADTKPGQGRQGELVIGQVPPDRVERLMREVRSAGFFEPPISHGIVYPDGPAHYIRADWQGDTSELVYNGRRDFSDVHPTANPSRQQLESFVAMWQRVRRAIDAVQPERTVPFANQRPLRRVQR